MSTTLMDQPAFTAADRCDRCGAQAYVRVILLNGELLLCAHHGREHGEALRRRGVQIQDASDNLG